MKPSLLKRHLERNHPNKINADESCFQRLADNVKRQRMDKQGMVWNGMQRKLRYGIWKVPEWNERQSSILPYQIHTRFRALYLQKNTYRCRVVINNIFTEVFNIYPYYLSTNRGTLVVYIAQTVYVLHHCKDTAI